MHRYRSVAAAPVRRTSECWQVIAQLVTDTLERSQYLGAGDVADVMANAGQVGRMLIAGGHLESAPLVLEAADLHLEITTVSGDGAFSLDENLNAVPGAAMADGWVLHLPSDGPLGGAVRDIAAISEHLSPDEPEPATAS